MSSVSGASETTALVRPSLGTVGDVPTIISILKMIMGAGGFAFPWAFAHMGIAGGAIAVFGVAGLGYVTLAELVAMKARVESSSGRSGVTYSDVAYASLGMVGALVVLIMSVTAALGAMSAYLAYISSTIISIFPSAHKESLIFLLGLCLLPVTWMQDFSCLSRIAGFGTLAVLLGYIVTIWYAVSFLGSAEHSTLVQPIESIAEGFGPIAFLLCIHFAIFPLITSSRATARPGGFESLAAISLGIAALVNSLFGGLGFIYFGSHVSPIVLNDMHGDSMCLVVTKLLVCIDLLCTYPLVFAAASQIIESFLPQPQGDVIKSEQVDLEKPEQTHTTVNSAGFHRLAIRTGLLLMTMAGGYKGNFGSLVSLVGDVSLTTLAFVLPPIMTLTLFKGELDWMRIAVNISVLGIGLVVGTLSSAVTVANMAGSHVKLSLMESMS